MEQGITGLIATIILIQMTVFAIGVTLAFFFLRWVFRVNKTVELLEEINAKLSELLRQQPIPELTFTPPQPKPQGMSFPLLKQEV